MRPRYRFSAALVLLFAALSFPGAATAEGERFLVGLEGGLFEPEGFSESYDAVYGDTLTPLGARFEWAVVPRFALALSTSFVSTDGEQVAILPGEGPVPTGIETELELNPWHLTAAYRIHPEGPWSGYVGGGLTLLRFDEANEFEETSGSELGYHAAAGVRRAFGRFVVGLEGLYSTVPDAIGESGAAAAFGEDDLGGLAAKLLLGYAF
jgi:hypothetical protein